MTRGGWTRTGTSASRRARTTSSPDSKAARTRQCLLDAARSVFASDGFVAATVESIVVEAGTSRGSFYTYFESKSDIFGQLAIAVDRQVTDEVTRLDGSERSDPVTNLELSNRRYLEIVAANSDVYAMVEQVGSFDPAVRAGRLASRRSHVDRVAVTIANWQASGHADPDIDPRSTAGALVSMLSNFAYWLHVGGDTYDAEVAERTLTDIWVRAVGLRAEPTYAGEMPA